MNGTRPLGRIAALLLLAGLIGGLPAGADPDGEKMLPVEVTRDLAYVEGDAADPRHMLDLYVPKGEGPWPVASPRVRTSQRFSPRTRRT